MSEAYEVKSTVRTNWAALKKMPDSAIKFTVSEPRTYSADWAKAVAHKGLPAPITH